MTALNSFIIVEEVTEEKSEGLIEYSVHKAYSKAKVISVGDKIEISVKKDDTIYYAKDCVKLKLDENIYAIDSKYIVAKE